MLNRVKSTLFLISMVVSALMFFPIAVIIWLSTVLFDKNLHALHLFTCFWASSYGWLSPVWLFSIEGKANIDPSKTYIIVSNHQSLVDIIAASGLFIHFKWVSKGEIFNIPLIGWNMYLNRYVRLKRGKKHQRRDNTRRLYRACERHLNRGSSVYIFPEGSRSNSGDLRPFREGAFVLAKRLNLPILPIAITGSRHALSADTGKFSLPAPATIQLEVLPPIYPQEQISAQNFAANCRSLILDKILSKVEG